MTYNMHAADAKDILRKYWDYEDFRPLQEEIIRSVLSGKDSLAVLPTGAGKSICFQVPALAREGICIVISPLIALMKDQVDQLKRRNIPALMIHSGMKRADVVQTLKNATHDYFKFLYLSPERLETSLFAEYLPALNVNLIAVDEAHCISQWGHDFRPSFLRIAEFRKELPGVPVLALTASATPEVQKDICQYLDFQEETVFRQSFERKNISYSVFKEEDKLGKLVNIISKVPGSALVYCNSRKRTQVIVNLLEKHGIPSASYHAGLNPEERSLRQKEWTGNKTRVIVCTNAFGMGIDKPDVRLVVHADMPLCLENYYQEAGRAGRDGQKSYAVLLYNQDDLDNLNRLPGIRFPPFEQIREVYAAVTNFLQIPAYTGEFKSFNFRFDEFIRNFRLDKMIALYSLKALEQDGWIEIFERNLSPSTLVFTTSKRGLADFEHTWPGYEPLLTALLRKYEGVFDYPVIISENTVARLLKKEETEIVRLLKIISSLGVLRYTPRNEEPQIVFKKNRVPVQDLSIDRNRYHKRKQSFIARAAAMTAYTSESGCRSRFISHYFGDEMARDCGVCDNCLTKAKKRPPEP